MAPNPPTAPVAKIPATSLRHARCLFHPLREAAARCPRCGGTYCRECVTDEEGFGRADKPSGADMADRRVCLATSQEEKSQKESDKAEARKRRVGYAGRIACLPPRADQIWYQHSGEDQDGHCENKAINEACAETDPESTVTPCEWRSASGAARHDPAQTSGLAIGAHPVSRNVHQIRLCERPSALGTDQNCFDRRLLTHWISSLVVQSRTKPNASSSPRQVLLSGAKTGTLRYLGKPL